MPDQKVNAQDSDSTNAITKRAKPKVPGKKGGLRAHVLASAEAFQDTDTDIDREALFAALNSFRRGDFSIRLPNSWKGLNGKIADSFNTIAEMNESMSAELERISRVVGREGRIDERVKLAETARGDWAGWEESVNMLISDLVWPLNETARVIGAVANGDLSQKMATQITGRALKGEFKRTATTVNTMVKQLGSFASEVTRVAREVGTEGKLGGQARVRGVAGTWKDLTDSVNLMAGNLNP